MEKPRKKIDSTNCLSNIDEFNNVSNDEESDEDFTDDENYQYKKLEKEKPRIHKSNKNQPVPKTTPQCKARQSACNSDQGGFQSYQIIILIVGITAASAYFYTFPELRQPLIAVNVPKNLKEQQNIIYSSVLNIKDKFPNQNDRIWEEIIYGIYDVIINPEQPSVMILYATKPDTMNCLAKYIAQVSSSILNGSKYLNFNPKDLEYNTEETINEFKKQVSTQKAIVFENLLHTRPPAFRAFHNLFDRYNPLIKGVVYIATILMTQFPEPQLELSFLENHITNLFKESIESDVLQALIARITDSRILRIQSEKNVFQC